jgi:hypothetical protein
MRSKHEQLKLERAHFINLINEEASQVGLTDVVESEMTIYELNHIVENGASALHSLFQVAFHQQNRDAEVAAYILSTRYSKSEIDINRICGSSLSLRYDICALLEFELQVPESDYLQRYFSHGPNAFREIFKKFKIEMAESVFLKYSKEQA